jgi:hypothetical protein
MKVIVTSTYENVNLEWLGWWLNRLETLPENKAVVRELRETGSASYSSKDPTSEVTATTTYEVKP